MKLRFICIVTVLICLLSFNVFAADSQAFELELSKDYNTLYLGEDATSMAKRLNMDTKELKSYMEENGVLMIAVSKDRSRQIRVCEEETEFSSLAEDISAIDKETLSEFAQVVTSDNNSEFEYVTNNDRKYIKFSSVLSDSGGSYVMTQYVTICKGRIYRFCFYNSGKTVSSEADEVFADFKLLGFEESKLPGWLSVVFVLGIAAFTALSVAMIIGIIKEKRTEKTMAKEEEKTEIHGSSDIKED